MATVIKPEGSTYELGDPTSLKVLQGAVEGYLEPVRLSDGRLMYVNEDGRLNRLPPNPAASLLARQDIVGSVVVLTLEETQAAEEG